MDVQLTVGTVNPEAIEPKDYFKVLKGKLKKSLKEKLEKQLTVIAEQILEAKEINQKHFLHRLSFTYEVLMKEQLLLASGIDTFVYKDDVKVLLEKVTPKNSVRIIELDRYPRAIPSVELKKIKAAKDLGLFDDFCVVFTDFTGGDYTTEEEKKVVARNRDPVVFGFFKHEQTGFRHDRFYLVADWQDEFCELDFTSMVEKMAEVGIRNPVKKITTDDAYLREIVREAKEEMSKKKEHVVQENKTFFERLKTFITGK